MSTTKRVIKNTGFLYAKMGITVFISLYTTRLILNSLGASDFGLFNIVAGAIGMLGFFNSTLANATQRFMSYAEGKEDLENKIKIFNVSIILHLTIAIITTLLLIVVMRPLFNSILNLDINRIYAAKIVYGSLVISTFLTIINVPYDAIMNAHENMLYYSIIGIFESILRLIVAYMCVYTSHDKLIVYGILMAFIPMITLSIMKIYCHKHYTECVYSFKKHWDFGLVKQIASFSGWNFLTAISSLLSAQGIGLVLNHFYGTVLNAAQGIAQQLNGQMSSFAMNMMKALNPVIVKNAGARNMLAMNNATIAGCKYSTYLTLFFAVPFIIEMPYILKLWLKNIPEWTSVFCVLQIIQTIICQMANSASTAVYAQGDIKGYAIYKSIMNSMPVLLTYISFRLGGGPYWLYIPMIVVWAIGGDIVIIVYAKKKCGLLINKFFSGVVLPVLGGALTMYISGMTSTFLMPSSFLRLIITCLLTTVGMLIAMCVFGMQAQEKEQIKAMITSYIYKK